MLKSSFSKIIIALFGLALLALLLYQVPAVHNRLSWRLDIAQTYLRGVANPVEAIPTPKAVFVAPSQVPSPSPTPESTQAASPLPPGTKTATPTLVPSATSTATALPDSVSLPAPDWVQQDWNNCGPAALTMYLRYYGWSGDQYEISDLLKPARNDRNVNIEELDYYVRNYAGWLNTLYRVGGDIELLKQFVAEGIPVMIESSFYFEAPYWPNDDLWAAHYLLVTGYDQEKQTFILQDTFHGPNEVLSYETLDEYWQPFNRLYMLVYTPDQEETVKAILGDNWDEERNRQHAKAVAQAEIDADSEDGNAWFNLGTNLLYFEQYQDAALAYDEARKIGWPQRMLRYQFGPFFAYFHAGRNEDLLTLTEYALQRTPNSEEAHLWRGWGRYRNGDVNGAVADFRAALEVNPNNWDAQYALDFVLNQ
ncbi:MAG: C39 family peptidase [Anaerolineales bacterium]